MNQFPQEIPDYKKHSENIQAMIERKAMPYPEVAPAHIVQRQVDLGLLKYPEGFDQNGNPIQEYEI